MDKKKVLFVEDRAWQQKDWLEALDGKVEIISALSIAEAEEKFTANTDIAAIVMDACVPGDEPNTIPLVKKFRETFTGPMIATSSYFGYRQMLVRAGCDHDCAKYKVPEKLCEILGL